MIGEVGDAWDGARIRIFLVQHSKAVDEQQQGRCNIVYMDESYVSANHARKLTWHHPDTPERRHVVRPSGKGKRLVLGHAFTQHGWLTLDSAVHNDRAEQWAPFSELIDESREGRRGSP